mgnify:CR=1 FL=1
MGGSTSVGRSSGGHRERLGEGLSHRCCGTAAAISWVSVEAQREREATGGSQAMQAKKIAFCATVKPPSHE